MTAAECVTTTTTPAHEKKSRLLRMYAVQAAPGHLTRTAPSSLDSNASAMARVPIAALLSSDRSVEKFQLHGRTYYKYQNDMYNFPSDDIEFERLDILHHMIYMVALRNEPTTASFRSPPRRILDVGFGTGFWMLDIEKKFPTAEVIGIDLDNSIGNTGNSRCVFKAPVDFTAPTWPVENSSVDLVHMAQLCGCVPNWLDHYSKAFRCLRPGTGQIEHVEIDWKPQTNEAQYPDAAMDLWNWWGWMCQASQLAGKSIQYREDTEALMERAGFVDVTHVRVRIPLYTDGRKDRREWALAHSYQTAMGHTETQSFTGFSMALFTRYLRLSPEQVYDICQRAVRVIGQRELPLHINLHIWTARRPQG